MFSLTETKLMNLGQKEKRHLGRFWWDSIRVEYSDLIRRLASRVVVYNINITQVIISKFGHIITTNIGVYTIFPNSAMCKSSGPKNFNLLHHINYYISKV